MIGSDLRRTGWFESSHELLDRFHENVVWGMRGNFVDVPTDCPQRDERLGWTGDIQVFSPTASFLFDSAGFLANWLADLAAEQHKDGSVPFVIPDVLRDARPGDGGLGRRGDDRAVGALPAHRRPGAAGPPAAEHAGVGGPDGRPGRRRPALDRRLPVRRLARPDRAAGRPVPRQGRPGRHRHRPPGPLGRDRRRRRRAARRHAIGREYAELAARVRAAFAAEYATEGGRVLERRADHVRAGPAVGAAADTPSSARRAGRGWPTWCGPPASGSAPASSARR